MYEVVSFSNIINKQIIDPIGIPLIQYNFDNWLHKMKLIEALSK